MTYKTKVIEIHEVRNKILREKEIRFIEDMREKLLTQDDSSLSQPQKDWIDRLYDRACASDY